MSLKVRQRWHQNSRKIWCFSKSHEVDTIHPTHGGLHLTTFGGVQLVMGYPKSRWMVSFMVKIPSFEMDEHPGGSPMTQETSTWWFIYAYLWQHGGLSMFIYVKKLPFNDTLNTMMPTIIWLSFNHSFNYTITSSFTKICGWRGEMRGIFMWHSR